jgi:hypothetical protein
LIDKLSTKVNPGDIRDIFRDIADVTMREWSNSHTHCDAAQYRSEVQALAREIAAKSGLKPWVNSLSNSDRRNGFEGTSSFWNFKDATKSGPCNDPITSNHLVMLHDDDYYVDDLEMFLARANPSPVLISTFQPLAVAGQTPDGYWVTNADNTVTEVFAGGAVYRHALYDWLKHDHITAKGYFTSVVYLKEVRVHPKDPTRLLVLLTPERVMHTIATTLIPVDAPALKRIKAAESGFVVRRFFETRKGNKIPTISIARPGDTMVATLPLEVLRNVFYRWGMVKVMATSTAQTHLERSFREKDADNEDIFLKHGLLQTIMTVILAVFAEAPEIVEKSLEASVVELNPPKYEVKPDPYCFTPLTTDVDLIHAGKPLMRSILHDHEAPWCTSQVFPTSGQPGEESAVAGRVLRPKNTARPPLRFTRYARELCDHVVKDFRGCLHPVDSEEVLRTQTSANQRSQLEVGDAAGSTNGARPASFLKAEPGPKFNYPRVITTVGEGHKLDLSRFSHALSAQLKTNDRYAFVDPQTLKERILRVGQQCRENGFDKVLETDYSMFDGAHSAWEYEMEEEFMKAAFAREYHSDIKRLIQAEQRQGARTKSGVYYNTGDTRLSGSPNTSLMNTYINMVLQYCMLREAGYDRYAAYLLVGLAGGDDGIMVGIPKTIVEETMRIVGRTIKCEYREIEEPVQMLARWWINIGEPDGGQSFCDVLRQLSKLHLTPASNGDVSRDEVCARKALNLEYSDRNTLVLGPWARSILRNVGGPETDAASDMSYWRKIAPEQTFEQLSEELTSYWIGRVYPDEYEAIVRAHVTLLEHPLEIFPEEILVVRDVKVCTRVVGGDTILEPDEDDPAATPEIKSTFLGKVQPTKDCVELGASVATDRGERMPRSKPSNSGTNAAAHPVNPKSSDRPKPTTSDLVRRTTSEPDLVSDGTTVRRGPPAPKNSSGTRHPDVGTPTDGGAGKGLPPIAGGSNVPVAVSCSNAGSATIPDNLKPKDGANGGKPKKAKGKKNAAQCNVVKGQSPLNKAKPNAKPVPVENPSSTVPQPTPVTMTAEPSLSPAPPAEEN